jgi:hypothetical protein
MKTKTLIICLVALSIAFSYLTVRKMKANASRDYKVLLWKKFDVCFLIAPDYTVATTPNGFKYTAGKNSGEFISYQRGVDSKMKQSELGEFSGGYSKEVDFRTFEYEVAPGVIIQDRFDFAKKKFANLLPVRSNCSKYLERFPVLQNL